MTAQQAILTLGTVTLTGCGAGLVLIHDKNPLLKGLNWMGASLVVGGLAAALTLGADVVHWLEPVANAFILLAFVCCNRADHYLIGRGSRQSRFLATLLLIEACAVLLQWAHLIGSRGGILALSLTAGLQVENTARLVGRAASGKGQLPTRITVAMMRSLVVANVVRAACAALGLLAKPEFTNPFNLISYGIFVAFAIGLAFAFFWRTTTKLSLELEQMASTDPLTRVYNRRVFLSWCENEHARSLRAGAPFSVLMVDFDHFKRINDTHGHHTGDKVLCAGVERIQDAIRGIDILCRWGGEEFAVLLPNASAEATQIVAERVRRNIPLLKCVDPQSAETFAQLELSASIGTASFDGAGDTIDAMLQRADAALYEAKRKGRNCVIAAPLPSQVDRARSLGSLILESQA